MTYLPVDGIETYYETPRGLPAGEGQAFVLLIHGAGGSSRHWQPLLAHLSERVYPILIDLPGHGRSSGTVLRSVDDAVTFLDHFLTLLGVEQPIGCAGHSLGGLIAQRLAMLFPPRLARLVLIATSARIRLHSDFLEAALTGCWNLETLRKSFGPGVPRDVQNLVLNEFPKTRVAKGSSDFMGLSNCELHPKLSALSIPTLIVVGDDDVIISPRHSRFLHQRLPHSILLLLSGGGHYVHVEQPNLVADALNRFIVPSGKRDASHPWLDGNSVDRS